MDTGIVAEGLGSSTLFGLVIAVAAISFALTMCGRKQRAQSNPGNIPPKYVSKSCNKKSGLLNDDPDLKSDKLIIAGRLPNSNLPATSELRGTTLGSNAPTTSKDPTGSKDLV